VATDPIDTATLQTWLSQAETALHNLRIGAGVQRLRHNQKELSYNSTNIGQLALYVSDLRGQLGLPGARKRAQRVRCG
jgi:hypothetical protein